MKSKIEKELLPHPRQGFAYFIWAICLIFNFYLYLVQFSAWGATSERLVGSSFPSLGVGRLLLSYNVAVIIFQFPIALLIDKFGPRRMTSLVILVCAIGVLILSFSGSAGEFWWGAFLMGLGGTVTTVNILKIVSNWFHPRKFTLLLAWTFFALIIGAMVGQWLTHQLTHNFDWSKVMFNYGLIGILYAIIFFVCVRDSAVGISYKIVPPPRHFNLSKSVKKALKKGENYALAIGCALAFSQWFSFYGVWHLRYFKASYIHESPDTIWMNLYPMIGFAIGMVGFLYLGYYTKRRKVYMLFGTAVALILSICTLYIPNLPFGLHVTLDFVAAISVGSMALAYAMIHEKNIPAITATVVGMIVFFLAVFRLLGEVFILTILGSFGDNPATFSVADYQSALIVLPFSLLFALIALVFVKENHGEQVYEE
ncbi:MFS transporter [Simkania sp.]|uniref:MFS transporter n=1 Tax=Simkania sp. TaxID=34094 RepID=UPI003B52727F